MATDDRVEITLGLKNQLSRGLERSGRDLQSWSQKADSALHKASRGFDYVTSRINGLGTVAALLGGGSAVRGLIDFDSRLRTIANTAQVSDARLDLLRRQVLGLSGARTGQLGGELVGGLSELVEAGMDLDVAIENLEVIGKTATATGSDVGDLAKMVYFLSTSAQVAPEEMQSAISAVAMIANQGSFSLNAMAQYLPETIAGMRSLGMTGKDAAIMAATGLQMGYKSAGDAARGATQFRAFQSSLIQNAKTLKKELGVDVFRVDESGARQWRDLRDVIRDIAEASGGDIMTLQKVFKEQEARSFIAGLTQDMDAFEGFLTAGRDGDELLGKNFDRHMSSAKQQLRALRSEVEKFMTLGPGRMLEGFTSLLRILNEHPRAIRAITGALLGLAALTTLNKAANFTAGLLGAVRGGGGGAGGLGGGLVSAAAGGATPVMVMNWPGGMGGTGGGLGPSTTTIPGGGRKGAGFTTQQAISAGYLGWEIGTGVGTVLRENVLAPTGGSAVLQKHMARIASLWKPHDEGLAKVAGYEGMGWVERYVRNLVHTVALPFEVAMPKVVGEVSAEEIADSQAAERAATIPISMTMHVLDDRIDVRNVEGVDQLDVQMTRQ